MNQTITVNLYLFIGICAMAALGFVSAVINVFKRQPEEDSPFTR